MNYDRWTASGYTYMAKCPETSISEEIIVYAIIRHEEVEECSFTNCRIWNIVLVMSFATEQLGGICQNENQNRTV